MAFYYDYVQANAAGRASTASEVLAAIDVLTTRTAGSASDVNALAAAVTVQAQTAGRCSEADALHHSEVVQAATGGKAQETDTVRFRDVQTTRTAGSASAVQLWTLSEFPTARQAGHASTLTAFAALDMATARTAGKMSATSQQAASDIVQAITAGRAAESDLLKGRESPQASAGVQASVTTQRNIVEVVSVRRGARGAVADTLAGREAPSARTAISAAAPETRSFDVGNLVRNVRANCRAALPECTTILEAIPDQVLFKTLTLPFLVIVFGQPQQSRDWAVNDVAQVVPCEFVYVAKMVADGATDNSQALRSALSPLETGLLSDYRQKAQTGSETCNGSRLVASPLQRQNEYQRLLQEIGQQCSAMVTGFEFEVIESVAPP